MNTTPPASPNEHGEGGFEWLSHETEPVAHRDVNHPDSNHPDSNHRDSTHLGERVALAPTHPRLDPLTVQGVINRVLVLVLCLIAVGATYEAVSALSSSKVPRSTAVTPSLLTTTTARPKVAATIAPKPTTTLVPATTVPPVTAPTTTVPATTPRTTPRATNPPATFPQPVFTAPTSPPTTPQTIQVPSPTTSQTGPSDTVVVPFK